MKFISALLISLIPLGVVSALAVDGRDEYKVRIP